MSNDYELHFGSISNNNGFVRFVNHLNPDRLERIIGVNINDDDFKFRLVKKFPSIIADLIDLAVAIQTTDRLCIQSLEHNQCRIHVVLPLRNPQSFRMKSLQDKIEDLLEEATGSRWIFDFQQREEVERSVVKQSLLMSVVPSDSEIALWSGGLDSLAGLYTRLRAEPEKRFILFGTGGNNNVYNRQKEVAKQIDLLFPNRCFPCLIPIGIRESDSFPKNSIYRSRGIVFTLLGIACAYLMGQRVLNVYENGVGAINLPYRASAIGLDHTRSVHPLTLLRVSDLVSELFSEQFQIRNPFLFQTKAQMCQALAKDGRNDLPAVTQSCDSQHRKPGQQQCGYCSSCLLRRQALAAAGIEDRTRYVVTHGKPPSEDPSLYFRNMREQVRTLQHLLTVSEQPSRQWESLTGEFPKLDDIVDNGHERENLSPGEMRDRLIQLYQTYITEWSAVESRLAKNLLDRSY